MIIISGSAYFIHKQMTKSTLGLILARNAVGSETLVANLDSSDRDLVMTSLGILSDRADPSGRDKAIVLLESSDNYIWLNAALYLGTIGDVAAIPYLIKALKHRASGAHDKAASLLSTLAGQAFGKDQEKWIAWWKTEHPDSAFVFRYLDLEKEASMLDETSYILISAVVDPLRISHVGPQVRLIGIRLKEDAPSEEAVNLLRSLLEDQFVQLEFDDGPTLDGEGARRAFVYWTMSSPVDKMRRSGLPPVPFKSKTLINAYLLNSGLYDVDLDSVDSDTMKEILRQAAEQNGP